MATLGVPNVVLFSLFIYFLPKTSFGKKEVVTFIYYMSFLQPLSYVNTYF